MTEPKLKGYQPTQTLDTLTPPSSAPAYKPYSMELVMSVIDQLHTRIQNVESDLRAALEKISNLEQKVNGGEA